ncbi:MAG: hypothetical protein GTO17_14175 [Candidatus Aminicenantes bacterium]|nr:hypothetical protein [Candidatus Aminicenantes bacterium]
MKAFFNNLVSSLQQPSEITREGLPYWIFWLLLCVILLLLLFIFLRDKDLRQRINSFFFGARRRIARMRLQVKIKKENQNKIELFKELGNKTWEAGISHLQTKRISTEISALEKKKFLNKKEIAKHSSDIKRLEKEYSEYKQNQEAQIKEQEEGMKPHQDNMVKIKEKEKQTEKELKNMKKEITKAERDLRNYERKSHKLDTNTKLSEIDKNVKKDELKKKIRETTKTKEDLEQKMQPLVEERAKLDKDRKEDNKTVEAFERKIRALKEEEKRTNQRFERDIKKLQRKQEHIKNKNQDIEKRKLVHFENLGKKMNEVRVKDKAINAFYTQIDKIDKTIKDLKEQIQSLSQ